MSKKPCPILYFILLYKLSQDFLGRLYIQVHSVYCVCVNWSKYNEHPLIKKHYNTVYPRSLAPFYILSHDFLDRQYIQVLGVPYTVCQINILCLVLYVQEVVTLQKKHSIYLHQKMRFSSFINYYDTLG